MTGGGLILVVEDSEEDTEAIQRALSRSHPFLDLEFAPRSEDVLPGSWTRPRGPRTCCSSTSTCRAWTA